MDHFQAMRTVLAIAEQGSLTAAAAGLEVSLPTVVRVLAAAERRLGVRLFDRTTRQVRLTEEGSLYVEVCRRVLGDVAEIEDALRDRRSEPTGTLAITAPALFGRLHVAPVLNGFLAAYPGVDAKLLLLDRVVDLIEEGIDVAVRIGHGIPPDLVAVPVGQVRRQLCAAPALLAGLPPMESPQVLAAAPFVRHTGLVPGSQLVLRRAGEAQSFKPSRVRLSTNSGDAAIAACRAGLGVGVFLSYQVEAAIAAGELRSVLDAWEPEPWPVCLVYPPSRRLSARSRAFIGWAKQQLAERLV